MDDTKRHPGTGVFRETGGRGWRQIAGVIQNSATAEKARQPAGSFQPRHCAERTLEAVGLLFGSYCSSLLNNYTIIELGLPSPYSWNNN